MQALVESIVKPSFEPPDRSGMIIGTLHQSRKTLVGFGQASERLGSPDGDTLFEIGSVTKVFTASLLASLVGEGLVGMDDPAMQYLPDEFNLPLEITLERLATHTAGIPKMPSNLLMATLKDRRNPYAVYSNGDLHAYLSKLRVRSNKAREAWVKYSNLGYVLLGQIIERRLNLSYEASLIERICRPLGLEDTCIRLAPEQQSRLAAPHSSKGRTAQNWDLEVFAGAGALRSTGNELLTFLSAQLGNAGQAVRSALDQCQTVLRRRFRPRGLVERLLMPLVASGIENIQRHYGMALGWMVAKSLPDIGLIHWHHGATGGYRAFLGFVKERDLAVVILANSGPSFIDGMISTTKTDELGFRLLQQLANNS